MPMRRLLSGGPKGPPVPPGSMEAGGPAPTHAGVAPTGRGRSARRYDPAWDDWKHARRWPGVLASCLVVLIFLSALIWYNRPQGATHHHGNAGLPSIAVRPAFIPAFPPVGGGTVATFTGKGSTSGLVFNARGGLTLIHTQCLCANNFDVTILNVAGDPVAFPVIVTKSYDAVQAVTVPAGKNRITVVGSGPWTIRVIQPTATTRTLATPFSYFSEDPDVVGPFTSPNRFLTFKFLPYAGGSVSVYALNLQGLDVLPLGAALLTATTASSRDVTLAGMPNPFYLEVVSTGLWSLTVQRTAPG